MNKSNEINEVAKALCQFQSKMPTIEKNAKGYGYKYTDLPTIIETIKPLLAECKLSLSQIIGGAEGEVAVTTMLMHESGQFLSGQICADVNENKNRNMSPIQAAGSVITYLRRYGLSAILGLVTDEDTDGAVLNPEPAKKKTVKPTKEVEPTVKVKNEPCSVAQLKALNTIGQSLYGDKWAENKEKLKEQYKVESTKDINKADMKTILDLLSKKQEVKNEQ